MRTQQFTRLPSSFAPWTALFGTLFGLLLVGPASRADVRAEGINPAAALCKELGGSIQTMTAPGDGGNVGLCGFERGLIEEWTLFKAHREIPELQAVAAYFKHEPLSGGIGSGGANPASLFCRQEGGRFELVEDYAHNQLGVCVFPDQSAIEEWTLFGGPTGPGQEKLAHVLRGN